MITGVRWSEEFHAEHIMISQMEELEEKKLVLFSGTPCHNAALKAYLGRDYENLLQMDFPCHGVPSEDVFDRWKAERSIKDFNETEKITHIELHKKCPYWNHPKVTIEFDGGPEYSEYKDSYYELFKAGYSLRPSCRNCRFTNLSRFGDITSGDFWGYKPNSFKMRKFDRGTAIILINSDKGEKLFGAVKKQLVYEEKSIDEAKSSNSNLYTPHSPAEASEAQIELFWNDYDKGISIDNLGEKYINFAKPASFIWLRNFKNRWWWVIKKCCGGNEVLIIKNDGSGQIGNRLLFCLHILSFAYENRVKVVYYDFPSYEGIKFQNQHLEKYLIRKSTSKAERLWNKVTLRIFSKIKVSRMGNCFFIESTQQLLQQWSYIRDFADKKNIYWMGWPFLDYRSVNKNLNYVREYFGFTDQVEAEAQDFISTLKNKKLLCGIHLRKGDYDTWFNGKYYFKDEEFIDIAKQINDSEEYENCTFILFSNERIDKSAWNLIGLDVVIPGKEAIEELCLMTKCKLLAGPPSTFSAWASFIGNVPRFTMKEHGLEFEPDKAKIAYIETNGMGDPLGCL